MFVLLLRLLYYQSRVKNKHVKYSVSFLRDPTVGALGTESSVVWFTELPITVPGVLGLTGWLPRFGDNFGCIEELQNQYHEFLYPLHPISPCVILCNHRTMIKTMKLVLGSIITNEATTFLGAHPPSH